MEEEEHENVCMITESWLICFTLQYHVFLHHMKQLKLDSAAKSQTLLLAPLTQCVARSGSPC